MDHNDNANEIDIVYSKEQAVHGDCIMSPTRVVESVLQEMVNSVINGEGQEMLPPTELGSVNETVPQGPTKWHDQCLYECIMCGKRSYSIRSIKKHCRDVHDDGKCQKKLSDVVYKCPMCRTEMSCDAITLENHVRGRHGFRNLGELREAYTIDEHLAAIKNMSDESAASIRSAELCNDKQRNGTTHGRIKRTRSCSSVEELSSDDQGKRRDSDKMLKRKRTGSPAQVIAEKSSQDDSDDDDVPLAKRKKVSVAKKQRRIVVVQIDTRPVSQYAIEMGKKAKVILNPFVVRDWERGQEATSDDEALVACNFKPSPKFKKNEMAKLQKNCLSKKRHLPRESEPESLLQNNVERVSESPSPPMTPPAQLSPSSSSEIIDTEKECDIGKKYLPPTPKNSSYVEERHGLKLKPEIPKISPTRSVVVNEESKADIPRQETSTDVPNTESERYRKTTVTESYGSKNNQEIGNVKATSKDLFTTAPNNHDVNDKNISLPEQPRKTSLLRTFRIVKASSRIGPPTTSASSSSDDESNNVGVQNHADHNYHGNAQSKTPPCSMRVPVINLEPLNIPHAKRALVPILEPPTDRKCMICKVCNKDDFEGHLMRHFKDEIQTMLGTAYKYPPFLCPKCPDRKHSSAFDLSQHFGRDHKIVLDLYFKRIGKPDFASHIPSHKENVTTTGYEEEFFSCSLCIRKPSTKQFANVIMLKSHLFDDHFTSHVRDAIVKDIENSLNCFEKECGTSFHCRKELIEHFHQEHFKITSPNDNRDRTDANLAFNEARYKTCPDCGDKFPTFLEMYTHCGRRHQERITLVLNRFGVDKTLNPVKMSSLSSAQPHNSSIAPRSARDMAISKAKNYHCPQAKGGVFSRSKPNAQHSQNSTASSKSVLLPLVPTSNSASPTATRTISTEKTPNGQKTIIRTIKLVQQNGPTTNARLISVLNARKIHQDISGNSECKELLGEVAAVRNAPIGMPPRPGIVPNPSYVGARSGATSPVPPSFQAFLQHFETSPKCHICNFAVEKPMSLKVKRKVVMEHLYTSHFQMHIRRYMAKERRASDKECPLCRCLFESVDDCRQHYAVLHKRVLQIYYKRLYEGSGRADQACAGAEQGTSLLAAGAAGAAAVSSTNATKRSKVEYFDDTVVESLLDSGKLASKRPREWTVQHEHEEVVDISDLNEVKREIQPLQSRGGGGDEDQRTRMDRIKKVLHYYSTKGMGKVFVQNQACFETHPLLPHCHECEKHRVGRGEEESLCQFDGFRKIVWRMGKFSPAGFLDPQADPEERDKEIWQPLPKFVPATLDTETAEFILRNIGNEFLSMVNQEHEILTNHVSKTGMQPIWKRMQDKTREMCDVCSTSLFNVHWTCQYCGVLVCFDCHEVRRQGSTAYAGKADLARMYRSRKRMGGGKNRDDHMWPYCKQRRVHEITDDTLQLTVMIAGDIVAKLTNEMYQIAKEYKIENVRRVPEIGAPELKIECSVNDPEGKCQGHAEIEASLTNAADPKLTRADSAMSEESGGAEEQFDLTFYIDCPVCSAPLSNCGKDEVEAHLTNHFADNIKEKISEASDPLGDGSSDACPECSETPSDLILHFGIAHGATVELVVDHVKSIRNTRDVSLPLNFEKVCRICHMDFGFKNVDPPGIRKHLLTHHNYRKEILDAAEAAHSGKLKSGKFYLCPEYGCGFASQSRSTFTDSHLAVYHQYLQKLYDGDKLEPTCKPPASSVFTPTDLRPRDNLKESATQNGHDETKGTPEKKKTIYFEYRQEKGFVKSEKQPAKSCDLEPVAVDAPRAQPSVQPEVCSICSSEVPIGRYCNHLAVHLALNWRDIQKDAPEDKCLYCQEASNNMPMHLKQYHFEAVFADVLPLSLRQALSSEITSTLQKRLHEIMMNRWCLLCESSHNDVSHVFESHYRKFGENYAKVEANKADGQELECAFCDGWPTFETEAEFSQHYFKDHLCPKMEEHMAFLTNFNDVLSVREMLRINLGGKKDEKADHAHTSRSELSIELPKRQSQSRRSSAASATSDDQMPCAYCTSGYSSYSDSDYYRHMSLEHFREVFERLLDLPSKAPFKCPRCRHTADDVEALITHTAEYHRMLEFILCRTDGGEGMNRDSHGQDTSDAAKVDLSDLLEEIEPNSSSQRRRFRCYPCGALFSQRSKASEHIVDHLLATAALPQCEPHICPVCFRESSSYTRLIKHYVTEHVGDVARSGFKSGYKRSEPSERLNEVDPQLNSSTSSCGQEILNAKTKEIFFQQMSKLENAIEFEDDKEGVGALPMQVKGDPRNVAALKKVVPQMHLLSENIYPGVEHSWLCDGKLLLLEHQKSPEAFKLFQDHWLRGQPVVIANSGKYLNPDLWTPESFSRDFGKVRHTLVNCLKGTTVPNAKLKAFWEGFQHVTKRLKDEQGTPMLLKLKDWPPTDDIAEFMPDRFNDLMQSLPVPEYTLRSGRLNIAGYIPDYFLKPELGPKMYIAYGSALYPHKGSTNLHIDMSDAVNCLVYVGLPKDGDERENTIEVFKEVDKAGCDMLMKKRVHDPKCKPGALWHIFHPGDTPKIRDLLKKVALEKGKRLDPHDDPIHDQSTYLDGELRMRLYQEYGVNGYAIIQCEGDTVFIPAGAAHQVRNLHNCIKIAEDFVSPENTSHCLHLTQEFRHLTEWHTNHEDKLQIKNIIYHAVKCAVTVLREAAKDQKVKLEPQ